MNKVFLIITVVFLFFACSGNTKKEIPQNETISQNNTALVYPNDSGVVQIHLIDSVAKIQIHKNKDQTIYLEFKSEGYKKIKGYLSSQDSIANIRFSQIILPDGTMDGPFGRDIDYDISQNGLYRLSVHENMMAGDPWDGDFYVDLKLSN